MKTIILISLLFLGITFHTKKLNHYSPHHKIYVATYYNTKFEGRTTSLGQKFSNSKFTAASSIDSLIGRIVFLRKVGTKRLLKVFINDKMNPKMKGRVHFDLSQRVMRTLAPSMPGKINLELVSIQ